MLKKHTHTINWKLDVPSVHLDGTAQNAFESTRSLNYSETSFMNEEPRIAIPATKYKQQKYSRHRI